MIIKDRVALGACAGTLGAIPQLLLNLIFHALNYSKTYFFTLAGGIFLREKVTDTVGGIFLGTALWLFTSSFVGFLMVLLFEKTGKDFWWLKGPLTVIMVMQILVYGFVFNMANTQIIPVDVPTNLSIFVENIIFGVVTGYLVKRWSDPPHA